MACTGVVLAGGASRRLGSDKRRLYLWGEQGPDLLTHTVQVVASVCSDVLVIMNDPEGWPGLSAKVIPDIYPNAGALGGIYTGIFAAQTDDVLVVAADMPLLNAALLQALIEFPFEGDALVPLAQGNKSRRGYEPLHAIYRRSCLAPIKRALEAERPTISAIFADLMIVHPPERLIQQYDPQRYSFLNINTPEDLTDIQHVLQ